MKKFTKATFPLCIAAMTAMLSCTGAGTRPSEKDMNPIVMRAFLFTGQPVKNVLLMNLAKSVHDSVMKTIRYNDNTFNQADTIDTIIKWTTSSTIDDALVTISYNGVSHQLTFSDSGQYEDRSGNLTITSGQTYRIDVFADDRHAWAETTVPSNSGISVSRDTIYTDTPRYVFIDSCEKYGTCPQNAETPDKVKPVLPDSLTKLTFKWNNPDRRYFYYRCYFDPKTPGFSPNARCAEYTDRDSLTVTTDLGNFQLGYPPDIPLFLNDSTGLILPKPGKCKLVLYSAPPEFGEVISDINRADSGYQDRWTASPTNVNDGLGYFSSFCTDSIFFTIVAIDNEGGGAKSLSRTAAGF